MGVDLHEEGGDRHPDADDPGERSLHAEVDREQTVVDFPAEPDVQHGERAVEQVVGDRAVVVEALAEVREEVEESGQAGLHDGDLDHAEGLEDVRHAGTHEHHDERGDEEREGRLFDLRSVEGFLLALLEDRLVVVGEDVEQD